ncbi:MAG: methylated-DNA--[protein]-cysteine S-methyltransferase [Bryobacteraceae bacterium]
MSHNLLLDRIESPIGTVLLVSDGESLCALDFDDCEERMNALLRKRYDDFALQPTSDPQGFSTRLRAYFAGGFAALNDVPASTGGTDFQRQVWNALRTIPRGATRSYGEIAAQIGKANASRAVGLANSLNPIAIAIPCHRVVGANSALTGYAGGLDRKRWLLAHEGADQR